LPHLFGELGISARAGLQRAGSGVVYVEPQGPVSLARRPEGAGIVRARLREVLAALGGGAPDYREQRHMVLRRGAYVLAAALGSVAAGNAPSVTLRGWFVDMLDGSLPIRRIIDLRPGEHAFLLDLDRRRSERAAVLAASARVRDVEVGPHTLAFRLTGPSNTGAAARLLLPAAPWSATAGTESVSFSWDAASSTMLLRHENRPEGARYTVEW
jgi:hypothetical protein